MEFKKSTEAESKYKHLEQMSINELLLNINKEDKTVPDAVEKIIPKIEALVNVIVPKMAVGGRLFYIGAGTSGRLGVVDASECPPTFGVEHGTGQGAVNIACAPSGEKHVPAALVGQVFFGAACHQRGPVHLLQIHFETGGFQLLLGHQRQLGDG